MSYISVKDLVKVYGEGENEVRANDGINFDVNEKELALIIGPSGAGKSTLLNILGGMDSATSGEVLINGNDIAQYDETELTTYRRYDIGFIFQNYNLIPNLTAIENVEMATEISNDAYDPRKIIKDVGLADRMDNFPGQLSGGEQQRVAIARALAKKPKLLLADEPTGALDYETGKQVLSLLQDSIEDYGATVLIITHNRALSPIADRIIDISDAQVREITVNEEPQSISEIDW